MSETKETLSFDQWMQVVNRLVEAGIGLSTDDLPDMPYRDWYDDGMKTARAAARAVNGAFRDE